MNTKLTSVVGALCALTVAVALTLWAHIFIVCGLDPESIAVAEWLAPLGGLLTGAAWVGSGQNDRRAAAKWGLGVALPSFILWCAAWCWLIGRSDPRPGLGVLTAQHLAWWAAALATGAAGGLGGHWLRSQGRKTRLICAGLLLAVVPFLMQARSWLRHARAEPLGRDVPLAPGMTAHVEPPAPDGTTVRLLSFDFKAEPRLSVDLYDADSDDAAPLDDSNTTWLVQTLDFLLPKLQARERQRGRTLLAVCNGGFFGFRHGNIPFEARHIAPLVVAGTPHYHIHELQKDWPAQAWVFGVSRQAAQARFQLVPRVSWERLDQFQTALVGVRPLRVAGRSLPLKPGIGNTTLKCSRTSLGWTADGQRLFLLTVRDPDGEGASMRQKKSGRPQSGGWDVPQVQQFWQRRGVPFAVLFDGGESTQLAYRGRSGGYQTVDAGYHLCWTFAYCHDRPLRVFLPMLPPGQSRGGVLNYLTITGPASRR